MKNKQTRRNFLRQSGLLLSAFVIDPFDKPLIHQYMTDHKTFDAIIVGGSFAGLSAAMALGRSMRRVLIIDSGKPCNRQTPHAHNFITHDGHTPAEITAQAKKQVLKYDTVTFYEGLALQGKKHKDGFEISTSGGETFHAKKLVFATGVTDIMPDIPGFAECWGISVLHCPYCHGYEVKHQDIGLLGNGELGYELCKHISNWSSNLVLFTNGRSTLTKEQEEKIRHKNIRIVEDEIASFEHQKGMIKHIVMKNGSKEKVSAMFARPAFKQHCDIPAQLGCEINEHGFIKVDELQRTSVRGIYAAGDNTSGFRALSIAIAAGSKVGPMLNKDLIDESFDQN